MLANTKMNRYLAYMLYTPISILVFLFIRLLSPLKIIRFGLINSHRIGHFSIEWEIFYHSHFKENKGIYVLSFHKEISNKFFANMIKKKIKIYPTKFVKLIQFFNNTFLGSEKHEIIFHEYRHDKSNKLINFSPSLKFTNQEIEKGESFLSKYKNKKIVCLYCRDGKYLSDKYNFDDTKNIRNTNVNDLIDSLKELEKKNYLIFRMGKNVEIKLNYTSDNVIDYANSKYRSDFMDIYLTSKCEFFISSGGGLDGVAVIFDKPILYINYVPIGVFPVASNKFLFSYKKYFDKNKNDYLSLSKIFQYDLAYSYEAIDKIGISLKNMDSIELKDAVLEMEKFYRDIKITDKQKLFKKKFALLVKKYPNNKLYFGNVFPSISNNFVKKNSFFLD